jgi:hypothetical protein
MRYKKYRPDLSPGTGNNYRRQVREWLKLRYKKPDNEAIQMLQLLEEISGVKISEVPADESWPLIKQAMKELDENQVTKMHYKRQSFELLQVEE